MADNGFPVRYGRDMTQAASGVNDLWLPKYGGEVLVAFDENLVAKDIVRMMSISEGNSMEFPQIHKMVAGRHAAGEYITGQDVTSGKRTITLDERPLMASFELDDIDKAKAHFEASPEYAKQAGVALARQLDKDAIQLSVNASRFSTDAGSSPFNGGGYMADPDAALTGAALTKTGAANDNTADTLPATATQAWGRNHALTLLAALESIAIMWDDRDHPYEDRNVLVTPSAWHALRNIGLPADKATTAAITGYNPFVGGPGGDAGKSPTDADSSRRAVLVFNGFNIWRTPNLPRTNVTTGEVKYRTSGTSPNGVTWSGDYTKLRALVIQKQAVGMLNSMGVSTEMGRDIRTQTDLFVTKMLYGGGALRPELAVSISIA